MGRNASIREIIEEDFDARSLESVGRFTKPPRRAIESSAYKQKLAAAATFYGEVLTGERPAWHLREAFKGVAVSEALTTGDFPLLFGDVIDREILAEYQATEKSWPLWAKRGTVPDFRLVNRFAVDGAEAVLASVPQGDQYPESNLSDTRYQYQVGKYGRRIAFAWEAMVNDDLDGLKSIPGRLARGAGRAEEKFATQLIADANGPNANFYTAGNKNQIIVANGSTLANPPLSVAGLQNAYSVLKRQVDKDGEPIFVGPVVLVIPPSLEITAQNIMNSIQIIGSDALSGSTAGQNMWIRNWMAGRLQIAVDYYLPIVSTTNGNTSWYLFADPNAGRPAVELGFLRGYEDPQTFVKLADAQLLGGGTLDPTEGDFDTDTVTYKIRHVFGGTRMDPKVTVASNGTSA